MKVDHDLEVGRAWCVRKKSRMGLSDGRGQQSGETSARSWRVQRCASDKGGSTKVFGFCSERNGEEMEESEQKSDTIRVKLLNE